jgi:hypothetical protein
MIISSSSDKFLETGSSNVFIWLKIDLLNEEEIIIKVKNIRKIKNKFTFNK